MREITFRAWHREEKQMYDVCEISFMKHNGHYIDEGCEGYWGDNHRARFSLRDVEMMQYTGIDDDDGVPIYEGDIVHYEFGEVGDEDHDCGEAEVQYDEFSAAFRLVNSDCIQEFWDDKEMWSFEVIGNSYENPELNED